jgi:hypothetical protein
MTSMVVNQVAYLRTSREFPEDLRQLTVEISKSYIDIASNINVRTIGIFPATRPAVTGESWYFSSQRQQTLRQVFSFEATTSINHGLDFDNIDRFTSNYGEYTDGTNWYGLISGTNVAITGQISFYVTPTQIVFVVDAGAPVLTRGNIVLTWLSQV